MISYYLLVIALTVAGTYGGDYNTFRVRAYYTDRESCLEAITGPLTTDDVSAYRRLPNIKDVEVGCVEFNGESRGVKK